MADDNWYRKKTWTIEDQSAFMSRLRKSRGAFHKAQYARIQALELQYVGTTETILASIQLLDMILAEWSSEAQLAMIHNQYAECYLALSQYDHAIESFREVFNVQRKQYGYISNAHLDFGWLAISAPFPNLYTEVLDVIDEFKQTTFPDTIYKDAAIRSIIYTERQDFKAAKVYAKLALSCAAITSPILPRLPKFGLVTKLDTGIQSQLQAILNLDATQITKH